MQVIPILTVINYRDTPFLTEMYFHEWQNNNKKKAEPEGYETQIV